MEYNKKKSHLKGAFNIICTHVEFKDLHICLCIYCAAVVLHIIIAEISPDVTQISNFRHHI